jgi:hypothetical protein
MATRSERRRAAQKQEQGRILGALIGVAMALIPSILPRLPVVIVAALLVLWLSSWKMARDGYKYRLGLRWAVLVMAAHGAILAAMGYWIWPRITVSPSHVLFRGYPNETFDFSVRNGRADDVYDVQIPFLIGYGKHLDSKFSAKTTANGDPPRALIGDYNYCYGKGPDVHKILPNEREVLIVHIQHLIDYGSAAFSITYAGGESIQTASGSPTFASEPTSYSGSQGTFGVRGDYRICRYDMHVNGAFEK